MLKQVTINRLKFILASFFIFGISFILRISLAVPFFLISVFIYLNSAYQNLHLKPFRFLNIVFLFSLMFFCAYFIAEQLWPFYYLPFCVLPMLSITLFQSASISLVITLGSALTIAALAGNNFYLAMVFLISGILSIVILRDVRRRSAIIRCGFIIGLTQAVSLFLIRDLVWQEPRLYLIFFFNGIASSVLLLWLLPLFESLFNTTTNISLLELADFNHPLLQRLVMEAPGTYHHSLVVGNLSEAAAQAIGAHALLARIGAYYHDVGKLSKPDYFSENQDLNANKHDTLSPTISKMVIINHVKEGLELAKKYKLNTRIVDFIQQHHGMSLVYYFYRRALESLDEDQEVKEDGFRYPGPKPNTKETAIVLLADSVEAATRALKDPTPARITEVVHKIINNRFIDHQLDECDLTLRDLEKISEIFIRILSAIYHSRVSYPEESKDAPQ